MKTEKGNFKKLLELSKAPKKLYFIAILLLIYTSLLNLIVSVLLKYGIDYALGESVNLNLWVIIIASIVSVALFGIFFYMLRRYKELINQHIDRAIKSKMLKKLTNGKYKDVSEIDDGDLLNVFTNDVETCSTFVTGTLFYFGNMLIPIVFGLAYIYFKSVTIGIFLTLCLPILYIVNKKLGGRIEESQLLESSKIDNQKTFFNEVLRNISIIKVFDLRKVTLDKNQKKYLERYKSAIEKNKKIKLMDATTEASIYIIETLVLVIGVYLHSKGNLEYGDMFAVWNTAIGSVIWPITVVPFLVAGLSTSYASLERVQRVLSIEEDEEKEVVNTLDSESKIILEDISFKYDDKAEYIINNLNLNIEDNKIIFIEGESGCGKSTLFKLILKLYEVNKGEIKIVSKGKEYKNTLDYISYIPQERNVFEGSIMDNLTLGESYRVDEVNKVMKQVNLEEVVKGLEKGYNSIIGKDINFSLGQEKRIAIARGLLNNKKFIFMDEPFSSLDFENSVNILECMKSLSKNCGFVLISHNQELNNYADKIINLKELS